MRPGFLHSGLRSNTLFAGPWVGEFGWELLGWQAWIRKLAPGYEKVIVCARESSRALYEEFCHEFIPHTISGVANTHSCLMESTDELARVLSQVPAGADFLAPRKYVPAYEQEFVRLGKPSDAGVDVLIHARGRSFTAQRNWEVDRWESLVKHFLSEGLRVGAVGMSSATLDVSGVEDFRDQPLADTLDCMASARLMLGPSSGPMHMASLCGTPHLVWTDKATYGMRKTSREKYESWWNPLDTPVTVLDEDGFNPSVDTVLEAASTLLAG